MATPAEITQAILDGPAKISPTGIYNFDNPPNIETEGFAILGAFLGLAAIAVCVRVYTKLVILRNFAKEDYFLLLATAFYIGYTGIAFKLVLVGAGTHQWDITVRRFKRVLYYIYTEEIVYAFSVGFVRVSIILQYLRIFQPVRKLTFMYIGCWSTLWFVVMFNAIGALLIIFSCTPRNKFWDPLLLGGHCLNNFKITIATGSFNVISDFVLLLLPQYEIWKLHMSTKKKATVSGLFLVALCACVTSILRLRYSILLERTGDVSYNIALLGISSIAETSIGIICCCLPIMPRFFQVVISPRIHSFTSSSFWSRSRASSRSTRKNISIGKVEDVSNASSEPPKQAFGKYLNLDGHELQDLKTTDSDLTKSYGEVSTPESADSVEGIRVTQEFGIDNSPATSNDMAFETKRQVFRGIWAGDKGNSAV